MNNRLQTSQSGFLLRYAFLCVLLVPTATAQVIEQGAFLNKYCVACHSEKAQSAGVSLESTSLTEVAQSGETLEKVVPKVGSGSMPPQSTPKPNGIPEHGSRSVSPT